MRSTLGSLAAVGLVGLSVHISDGGQPRIFVTSPRLRSSSEQILRGDEDEATTWDGTLTAVGDELALDFAYRRLNPIWYRVALADREMAAFGIDVGPAPIPIRVGSDASVVLDDMKVATYPEWICRAHDRGVHLFFDAHSGLETDLDTLLARSDGRVLFAIGKLVTEPDHSL